jgi:WD40 repeat protein
MHESPYAEKEHSSPAGLIFANLSFVCSIVALVAGFSILFWYAGKGEGSDMIGNSAIAVVGLLAVCVPLFCLAVLFSVIGLSLPGHRKMALGALCLTFVVPIVLWNGNRRAAKAGLERSIARSSRGDRSSPASNFSPQNTLPAAGSAHSATVSGVSFSRDGSRVVTLGSATIGAYPHEVKIWDTSTARLLESTNLPNHRHDLLPDGRIWASPGRSNLVFDPFTARWSGPFASLPGFGQNTGMLDGTNILVHRADAKSVVLWNLELGKEIASFTDWGSLNAVTIAPDGRTICFHLPRKQKLVVVDGYTGKAEELPADTFSSGRGLFSADSRMVAIGGIQSPEHVPADQMKRLGGSWQSGVSIMQVFNLAAKTNAVFYFDRTVRHGQLVPLAFSPDKRRLIAKDEWSLAVFDLERQSIFTHIPKKHYNSAASPDGRYIAVIPEGNPVLETWDATTGKPLASQRLPGFKHGHYKFFGFVPNTTRLAIWEGSTSIYLHDVTTTNAPVLLTEPQATSMAAKAR